MHDTQKGLPVPPQYYADVLGSTRVQRSALQLVWFNFSIHCNTIMLKHRLTATRFWRATAAIVCWCVSMCRKVLQSRPNTILVYKEVLVCRKVCLAEPSAWRVVALFSRSEASGESTHPLNAINQESQFMAESFLRVWSNLKLHHRRSECEI